MSQLAEGPRLILAAVLSAGAVFASVMAWLSRSWPESREEQS